MRYLSILPLALAFPIAFSGAASATIFNGKCMTYSGRTPTVPEVAQILGLDRQGAVTICTSPEGTTNYSLASSILRGRFGSCQYSLRSVFKRSGGGQYEWSYMPSQQDKLKSFQYAFISLARHGKCPPQGEAFYTQLSNVSEGVYIKFARGWEQMRSSEKAFHQAVASLPRQQIDSEAYRAFESSFANHSSEGPRLYSINLLADHSGTPLVPVYSISSVTNGTTLEIEADLVGGGIQILEVRKPSSSE